MKRTSSRLLLGLLGVATSAGLVLGGKAVADNVAKGAVEANAAVGDVLAKLPSSLGSGYGPQENLSKDGIGTWSISFGQGTYFGTNNKENNTPKVKLGDFISIDGVSSTDLYKAVAVCETPITNAGKLTFSTSELSYATNSEITYSVISSTSSRKTEGSVFDIVASKTLSGSVTSFDIEFDTILEPSYLGLLVECDDTYFRYKEVELAILEGSTLVKPADAIPVSVSLEQIAGSGEVYEGSDIIKENYSVSVTYGGSTINPDYSETVAIDSNDSRLTWNLNTEELGQQELTVTFKDGDLSVISNSLSIEVIADPFAGCIIDVLTIDNFPVKNASSYANGSFTSTVTGVTYKSNNAGGNNSIQLRSTTSNNSTQHAGIVTTTSIGTVDATEVTFNKNTSTKRVLDIYGSHEPFADPNDLFEDGVSSIASIAVEDGTTGLVDISKLEGAPYEYIGIRSNDGTVYLDQIRIGYTKATAPTDAEVVAKFVKDYMHLDDYNTNEGKCLGTDGYYVKARTALLALTPEQIELFKTDVQFAAAKERYEAWAKFNGDDSPYAGTFTASAAARINNETKAEYWIVGGISLAVIGLAAAMFFLRKKKEA